MMNLPQFEFIQSRSVEDTCSLLHKYGDKAALLAGGTAFIVALRYRLKKPEIVIGLKGLTGLNYISQNEKGVAIGSMTTLESLEQSPLMTKLYPSLLSAIQQIAVPPIRNQATLGGNLCLDNRCIFYNQSEFWRRTQKPCFKQGGEVCYAVEKGKRCQAVYSGDLAPLLMALEAEVKIISAEGEKIIPLCEFFTGRGEKPNVLRSNELLSEIRIPSVGAGIGFAYEKLRVREGMEFPMAGVAVKIKRKGDGTIEKAKVVLGAVGTAPIEVPKASKILEGKKPAEELFQKISRLAMDSARPVGNLAIDLEYRRKMVSVLTKRALVRAFNIKE
ncbi:MAG: FAD binding domain-containing protein [Thermodesulfobacteriota bacterium]